MARVPRRVAQIERVRAWHDSVGYTIHWVRWLGRCSRGFPDAAVAECRYVGREIHSGLLMRKKNPKVEEFVSRAKAWQGEMQKLRSILSNCGLEEELKWGKPCFMFEGKNIAIIQPFKEHCSLMFFKGALLENSHGLLRSQGENTQSAMRLEFTSEAQVKKAMVESYVKAAIAVEKQGLEVDFKAKRELELPQELRLVLEGNPRLAKAFEALTPGRKRAYVLHFNGAKQSGTRSARIEKVIPMILAGKGLNDR